MLILIKRYKNIQTTIKQYFNKLPNVNIMLIFSTMRNIIPFLRHIFV